MDFSFSTYLSPFTWRYGSPEMRTIWSEAHKRSIWRQIWIALAEAESEFGIVSAEQLKDLHLHKDDIDVRRALEIESQIHHDLVAELKLFAEQSPLGGGILHLGATSTDIEDNADVLRIREALDLVIRQLNGLLLEFCEKIDRWADLPIIAFTHLQPAEPSTLGYRLSVYAQDLYLNWQELIELKRLLRGKGLRGAVGSGASFAELIGKEHLDKFESRLEELLGLRFFPIATQVYPRQQDYQVASRLAGLGAAIYKFAFDLRFLQTPAIGEWSEPFGRHQVGSSAMPFKRNPIQAEKLDSLARQLAMLPRLAWDNAAHSLLERTLDDSANRRTLIPESFLIVDELLATTRRILGGLVVDEAALERNLAEYGPFAAVERVLMALGKAGANRQEMHERLRQHALAAWESRKNEQKNPLAEWIKADPVFQRYLPTNELESLMDISRYLGDAPERARALADEIKEQIFKPQP